MGTSHLKMNLKYACVIGTLKTIVSYQSWKKYKKKLIQEMKFKKLQIQFHLHRHLQFKTSPNISESLPQTEILQKKTYEVKDNINKQT